MALDPHRHEIGERCLGRRRRQLAAQDMSTNDVRDFGIHEFRRRPRPTLAGQPITHRFACRRRVDQEVHDHGGIDHDHVNGRAALG
jgi:hypothetical protein